MTIEKIINNHKLTGGQAFPKTLGEYNGMTLRDYFAAKAMQGLLANSGELRPEYTSEYAYKIADAMIAARDE